MHDIRETTQPCVFNSPPKSVSLTAALALVPLVCRGVYAVCSLEPGEYVWCVSYSVSITEWTRLVKWLVPVLTVVHVSAPLGGLLSEVGGEVG
jgi:hypothetical protein